MIHRRPASLAMTVLQHHSALPVLEWMGTPVLALARDGTIVFANWAFADMLGQTPELVLSLTFGDIFGGVAHGGSPVAALRANAETVLQLAHIDGSVVQARVSDTLSLGDDEVVLTSFDEMTDELWF